jgi:hypothetical protein
LLAFENDLKPAIDTFEGEQEYGGEDTGAQGELNSERVPDLSTEEAREEFSRNAQEQFTLRDSKRWLRSCLQYHRTLLGQTQRVSGADEVLSSSNNTTGHLSVRDITFDMAISFALRASYAHVEQSQNLEAAMIFTTVVLETIQLVGDQIEVLWRIFLFSR